MIVGSAFRTSGSPLPNGVGDQRGNASSTERITDRVPLARASQARVRYVFRRGLVLGIHWRGEPAALAAE